MTSGALSRAGRAEPRFARRSLPRRAGRRHLPAGERPAPERGPCLRIIHAAPRMAFFTRHAADRLLLWAAAARLVHSVRPLRRRRTRGRADGRSIDGSERTPGRGAASRGSWGSEETPVSCFSRQDIQLVYEFHDNMLMQKGCKQGVSLRMEMSSSGKLTSLDRGKCYN